MNTPLRQEENEVIGLIPAAGHAKRIAPLPLSKELFPLRFQMLNQEHIARPKVVSEYLIDKFKQAGISKIFMVIRKGKWDIPEYFGDGELVNMHLSYLMMREPFGPPFTLDQAYPFVRHSIVAFGFPDIMFNHDDVFSQLLERQHASQSDVVLALFPAHNPHVMDMVDIGEKEKIRIIYLKPKETNLTYCWLCAVWTPVFTEFMHDYLQVYRKENSLQKAKNEKWEQADLTVGEVIQAGIEHGLDVSGVSFPDGRYIDIGTPEDLVKSMTMVGWDSV